MSKKLELLNSFCSAMNTKLPSAERIEDYYKIIQGFSYDIIEATFKSWRFKTVYRLPSPQELQELLAEVNNEVDFKSPGPKTVDDLFGNKVRCETPCARELRQILKRLIGKVPDSEKVTAAEALKLSEEVKKKYGMMDSERKRKQPEEIMNDIYYGTKDMAIKGQKKKAIGLELKVSTEEKAALIEISDLLKPQGWWIVGIKDNGLDIKGLSDEAWWGMG